MVLEILANALGKEKEISHTDQNGRGKVISLQMAWLSTLQNTKGMFKETTEEAISEFDRMISQIINI